MTLYGRWSRWAAALAFGLAGLIGVGAATVLAAPGTQTAATAFELTLEADFLPPDFMTTEGGTFKSRAPFCASGRFVPNYADYVNLGDAAERWPFTCDDGTGSLTVDLLHDSTWRIVDGSGSYAGLRGRGSLRGEQLCGGNCDVGRPIPWRGTLVGVVDWGAEPEQPEDADTVAPTIAIWSATAAKLRRPAGAYALRLGIALRDDVRDNPVSYTLRASAGGVELGRRFGTATGAVSMTLRIRPPDGARTVRLQLTGVDPVGNAVSVGRALKLPH